MGAGGVRGGMLGHADCTRSLIRIPLGARGDAEGGGWAAPLALRNTICANGAGGDQPAGFIPLRGTGDGHGRCHASRL